MVSDKAVTTASTTQTLPLPSHAWTLDYLRLRLIAILVRLPVQFALGVSPYLLHTNNYLRGKGVTRKRILVPSRQKGRSIKVDVYQPESSTASEGGVWQAAKKPVHINWHGSGFVLPCLGGDVDFCTYMVQKLQITILDADYRKAPENPFPAAIEDAEDVALWTLAQKQSWDTSKLSLSGFSAGANLALSTSWQLGPERVLAVATLYPVTDFVNHGGPKTPPKASKGALALPRVVSRFFDQSYLVINSNRKDPRLSPLYAEPQRYPRSVYIACGQGDTLHDDGKLLIEKLQKEDHADAKFVSLPGMGHGFDKARSGPAVDVARQTYLELANRIQASWALAKL